MNHGIGGSNNFNPKPFIGNKPFQPKPSQSPATSEPFKTPDIFRPTFPSANPMDFPTFPQPHQPIWLPPGPSGPIIEVPNNFPMELPTTPGIEEWTQIPRQDEMPDWSKQPSHFPTLPGTEVNIPKQFPGLPGTGETWFFSS